MTPPLVLDALVMLLSRPGEPVQLLHHSIRAAVFGY
jgi:hypothetical protein